MRRVFFIIILALGIWHPLPAPAQKQYEVDLSKIEKKPYEIGGFLEFEPVLEWLDRDALFYQLKFTESNRPNIQGRYSFGLRLNGGYQRGSAVLSFTADSLLSKSDSGWHGKTKLYEGYLSLRAGPYVTFDLGKKVMKWGKGYAWNPVSFIDRPKDPEDPQEALEGFYVFSSNLVKSFKGVLKTVAFTPVLVPVTDSINSAFGQPDHLNFGGKLYFLLLNTDIDFLFAAGSSRGTSYGLDFSRNLGSNFEIHGEWAWTVDFERRYLDSQGKLTTTKSEVASALFGFRYLTANEITFIAEYYRNGKGFLDEEALRFYRFAAGGCCVDANSALSGMDMLRSSLGRPNPMRDYLYFRASQKEPYDILYLTPELTSIINLRDGSFLLMPGLTYSPMANLRLRFRGAMIVGGRNTEYGEKRNDYRAEMRLRYFF
jgi:hypothetical protein